MPGGKKVSYTANSCMDEAAKFSKRAGTKAGNQTEVGKRNIIMECYLQGQKQLKNFK